MERDQLERCIWQDRAGLAEYKCSVLEKELEEQKALTNEYKELSEALRRANREILTMIVTLKESQKEEPHGSPPCS